MVQDDQPVGLPVDSVIEILHVFHDGQINFEPVNAVEARNGNLPDTPVEGLSSGDVSTPAPDQMQVKLYAQSSQADTAFSVGSGVPADGPSGIKVASLSSAGQSDEHQVLVQDDQPVGLPVDSVIGIVHEFHDGHIDFEPVNAAVARKTSCRVDQFLVTCDSRLCVKLEFSGGFRKKGRQFFRTVS